MQEYCPRCRSRKIQKAGFRHTADGLRKRLKCLRCRKTFYPKRIRGLISEEKRARKFRTLGQYIWLAL